MLDSGGVGEGEMWFGVGGLSKYVITFNVVVILLALVVSVLVCVSWV